MAYGKSTLTRPEIVRLEIERPAPEVHELLLYTMRQLQRVANHCVVAWLLYHEQRQTVQRLAAGWPVHPCPPELCARWLRECQALCPDVHCATVLAVTNWLAQTYTSQNSPKANGKRWLQVLWRNESHWSYDRPLPIRLWTGNARFVRDERVGVVVRVDRIERPGKKNATSTPLRINLVRPKGGKRSAGHRLAYLAACEIAAGERKLAQSQLAWDARLRKWFLFATIDGPAPSEHAERDPDRVIFFRPGRGEALRIHADALAGGFGEEALDRVARVRSKLDGWRDSWRREHDGAGVPARNAAELAGKWRRQSAAICDALASEVVRSLERRSYGRVVWLDGDNRTAALALAGKAGQRDGRELFPFELLRRKLEKRLGDLGIEVVGRANFRSVKRRKQERRKKLAVEQV